jgi:acetyltransferase-like isoleucine patch superfamily enzyme
VTLFWRFADPILMRVRSRLEHLAAHAPSDAHERTMLERAVVGEATRLFATSNVFAPHREQITISDHCQIMGEILALNSTARCTIGHHCSLGRDSRIWTKESVTIGNFVLIAHLVDIHDNNSHSLDWRERREDARDVFERNRAPDTTKVASAPIVIEDDVWIGAKSTIMKGVRIGRGAVVAAASVVLNDVPPFTLVGGNPAREIKRLEPDGSA